MPAAKKILRGIPKLYRRQAIDLMLFGYITGATDTVHTFTVKMAVKKFRERFNVTEDEYKTETMVVTYNVMKNEYLEGAKTS